MQSQKGMWRRVDELGRVVIPKEIRIYLNVKSGDLIEFCSTTDNSVLLRKYHRIDDISDIANMCMQACSNMQNGIIFIASSDNIIASTNRNFININLNSFKTNENIKNILYDKTLHRFPILANGDKHGEVLLYTTQSHQNTNIAVAIIIANLLSKYLEY